eukprot:CAMPEP_0180714376 /NCGR_PEP_ID=MMETSP1038_2-20121128/12391_1 /TAXON_ID=632150 /ORGANISM="Azadinium spinosum, Strain 3D9" /LENGTH=136 /DNA_ID=CAMNT_0022746741 /DNA_START=73 /DNA_END=483 /DNA_ORIENTATION=-
MPSFSMSRHRPQGMRGDAGRSQVQDLRALPRCNPYDSGLHQQARLGFCRRRQTNVRLRPVSHNVAAAVVAVGHRIPGHRSPRKKLPLQADDPTPAADRVTSEGVVGRVIRGALDAFDEVLPRRSPLLRAETLAEAS